MARLEVSLMYMHGRELAKGANSVIIYSVLYLKLGFQKGGNIRISLGILHTRIGVRTFKWKT